MFAQLINRIQRSGGPGDDASEQAGSASGPSSGPSAEALPESLPESPESLPDSLPFDGALPATPEQRALIHAALDWVDAPLAFFDRDLVLQFANAAYAVWTGYERDALIGRPIDVAVVSDDEGLRPAAARAYAARCLAGEGIDVDLAHRPDGSLGGLRRIQFRPQRRADGEIVGVFCVLHRLGRRQADQTEPDPMGRPHGGDVGGAPLRAALRLAQDDVAERERKQRELTEGLPLPLVFIGNDGICRWANRAFSRLVGIGESALAGKRADALEGIPPETVRAGLAIAADGHSHSVDQRLMLEHARESGRQSGREARWYRVEFIPAFDRDNAQNGVYALFTDVHESRLATMRLQESKAHFRGYTENVPETIIFVDQELRFRYVNEAFTRRSKKTRDELLGFKLEDVFGRPMLERARDALERAFAGETFTRPAHSFFEGADEWYEARYLPVKNDSGEVEGVYVVSRSITDERRAERAVRERDEQIHILTDNLPVRIAYFGPDLRYRYCNQRFLADHGLSSAQAVGMTLAEVNGREAAAEVEPRALAALAGQRVEFERRMTTRTGEARWLSVTFVGDVDEDGTARGIYSLAYDITDSKRAEALRERERELIEAFIENFPQPLAYLDCDGVHRHTNRAYEEFVRRGKEEIAARTATEVFGSDVASVFRPSYERALYGERLHSEHEIETGGLPMRYLAADWLPDLDGEGTVRGVYLVLQDISETKIARRAYEESLRELQRAMDSVALPISFVDPDGRLRFVNRATTSWHGRSAEELIGTPLKDLMSSDDFSFAQPYIEAALAGESVQYEREMRYHDGIRRWVLIRYVATRDEDGRVTGFYTTATDIQARKKHEIALQQANALLSAHFENTPLASFTLDASGRVTRWSSQAELLFGWTREDAQNRHFDDLGLVDREFVEDFLPADDRPTEDGDVAGNTRLHVIETRRRDGTMVTCEWHIAALRDVSGRIASTLALIQDVSQRVEAERRLTEIAHRDTLTRLLNRNALEPTLRSFIERARQGQTGVAVLFLDLDHFKNINDTLGHRVGDLMLIEIATILRQNVRAEDQVVRIGGDEFMVVIGHKQPKAIAHETAQRILSALSMPIRVDNQRLSVTSSIGIAIYPDHGRSSEALIRSADLAMYRAKENGKNRFEFFSAMLAQRSERRSAVKGALKLALQKDALRLHFQPRVRIDDGQIVGAEALLRWTDPRLGVVSPKEFIVIAEESGLIHELGLYVFRKACRQLRDWQARGITLGTLSVNFSAHQLLVATFTDEVDDVIRESGVDPRLIEVEITETSMLFDLGVTRNVIADLKARGMRIAIDDFGTGFSSLSHLQQLDVDTLKIDQSFIRDMLHDPGDAAITTSVISLAKGLGLSTTAEGVEQERQLDMLREAGCDYYQGFLFSPAIVADDIEALLVEQSRLPRSDVPEEA